MLGFRGAARYVDEGFRPCFELECRALKRVREQMGLKNVWVMVPFVRTLKEAEQVVGLLAANGLKRGENGLKVIMMCEIPTNAVLADRYLEFFDGMSIGSNDMTQLTLGLDRDSAIIARLFDERDDAVKAMLSMAIKACRKAGKYIGICGQGPVRSPRPGALAARPGHREHVAQSRYRGRDLAVPRERSQGLELTSSPASGLATCTRRPARPHGSVRPLTAAARPPHGPRARAARPGRPTACPRSPAPGRRSPARCRARCTCLRAGRGRRGTAPAHRPPRPAAAA